MVAIITTIPTYATGINAGAQSADCDNDVLGTYTGPSTLSANWTANTINLDFYDGETKLSSGQCTYDAGITLPNDPTKTGYEFSGWKVRRASAAPSCNDVSCYDLSLNRISSYYHVYSNNTDRCFWHNFVENTISPDHSCSDSEFNDLERYEWKTTYADRTNKGISMCASNYKTANRYYSSGTPSGEGRYCWCKVTSINGVEQSLPWVGTSYYRDLAACQAGCADECSRPLWGSSVERAALYGLAQEVQDCTIISDKNTCYASYKGSDSCLWSNTTLSCHNQQVDDCSTITDENRCGNSYQDREYSCTWNGESCEEYWDD